MWPHLERAWLQMGFTKMGSHWSGADPESLDGCPHTQEQFGHRDHHTQRKGGCLQARERGPGQPLPHSPQRLRALPTPYVQTSSLQSCESNHFCCFETPFPAPAPPPPPAGTETHRSCYRPEGVGSRGASRCDCAETTPHPHPRSSPRAAQRSWELCPHLPGSEGQGAPSGRAALLPQRS